MCHCVCVCVYVCMCVCVCVLRFFKHLNVFVTTEKKWINFYIYTKKKYTSTKLMSSTYTIFNCCPWMYYWSPNVLLISECTTDLRMYYWSPNVLLISEHSRHVRSPITLLLSSTYTKFNCCPSEGLPHYNTNLLQHSRHARSPSTLLMSCTYMIFKLIIIQLLSLWGTPSL